MDNYKEIFAPDSGMLLEIRVFDMTVSDWNRLLDYLRRNYSLSYSENNAIIALPEANAIFQRSLQRSITLKIEMTGFTVNCHFFRLDQMQLNILPEDIDSEAKAQQVFALMTSVSRVLGKSIFLIPEFGSASPKELQKLAICSVRPDTGVLTFHTHP